uniref:Kappa-Theraphotoxin-Ct2a_1 n=1 Tax=Coremiocnemis tropix TaxID=1904443 RepID=A0A482Z7V3_CORTR
MKAAVFAVIFGLVCVCCRPAPFAEDQFASPNGLLKSMFVESIPELTPEVEGRYCQKWMWTCDEERKCCEDMVCRLWCKKRLG